MTDDILMQEVAERLRELGVDDDEIEFEIQVMEDEGFFDTGDLY